MVYPLSVQGTTIANWGNIFWNYFYLSISCLIVSHIAFFFAKLTETLFIIHTYVHTYIHTYTHTYILAPTEMWGPGFYTEVWGPWVTRYIFK